MPWLYCEKHGRERADQAAAGEAAYQKAGEIVLVLKGRLSRGPHLCDRCNVTLIKGDMAYLLEGFPRACHSGLAGYEFRYEREFFDIGTDLTAVSFGVPWPDDSLKLRKGLRQPQPRREPVHAQDVRGE